LKRLGKTIEVLDGAEVEQFLGVGRAQTKDERNAETRKLAWACRLVTRGGGIVLQAAIDSPYKETRDEARRQIGRFLEVFVECPIDTLIERDRTGRYKTAPKQRAAARTARAASREKPRRSSRRR